MEGIERIKILSKDVKDKALLKIVEYLISRKDMDEKYLNEEKSLKQMVEYINKTARKNADKAKSNMFFATDEEVFGWAIHYFDESNETLKLDKMKEISKEETKETIKKVEDKKVSSKKQWVSEGQLSLFDVY